MILQKDGKFHIIGWRYGLPGAVKNAQKVVEADGTTKKGRLIFKGSSWSAVVEHDGTLTGKDDQGHTWTLLRK